MTAQEVRISRDTENDILYVLKNGINPKTVSNIPLNADLTLRVLKDTHEVVGFTIDEFLKVCPEWKERKDYELMEEFDEILNVLNDACKRRLTQAASQAVTA